MAKKIGPRFLRSWSGRGMFTTKRLFPPHSHLLLNTTQTFYHRQARRRLCALLLWATECRLASLFISLPLLSTIPAAPTLCNTSSTPGLAKRVVLVLSPVPTAPRHCLYLTTRAGKFLLPTKVGSPNPLASAPCRTW